jgi:hypothetical protein
MGFVGLKRKNIPRHRRLADPGKMLQAMAAVRSEIREESRNTP